MIKVKKDNFIASQSINNIIAIFRDGILLYETNYGIKLNRDELTKYLEDFIEQISKNEG